MDEGWEKVWMADNSSLLLAGADHRLGIQLVFLVFLLAKASCPQLSAPWSITQGDFIVTAEHSTGSDSSGVKTIC